MTGKKRRPSQQGHVYQLPSGSWRAQIYVQGEKVSHTGKKQADVLEWIRQTLDQVRDGMTYDSLFISLRAFSGQWLIAVKPSIQPGTYIQYEQVFRDYINPAIGSNLMRELRPDQIQTLYTSLLKAGKGAYLIRKIHNTLHACLEHARILAIIRANPSDNLIVPPMPDKEMQILSTSEVSRLLIAVKDTRYEALMRLAVHTGMRQMEMLGLKWDDLDWTKRTLKIQRQLQRKRKGQTEWTYGKPKTKAARRTLNIGQPTMAAMKKHYERQQTERIVAKARWQENALIFPSSVGTPVWPKNLLDDFKVILEKAGLPAIRFHDLRHTAASIMIDANKPLLYICHRLGHARPSITLNIYGHLMPESLISSADELDDLISPVEIDLSENVSLDLDADFDSV